MPIVSGMDDAMYMCSRPDYEPITTKADLKSFMMGQQIKNLRNDWITSWTAFEILASRANQGLGQAFMNSLPEDLYDRLSGTLIDPFYQGDREIRIAIDYLLFSKE